MTYSSQKKEYRNKYQKEYRHRRGVSQGYNTPQTSKWREVVRKMVHRIATRKWREKNPEKKMAEQLAERHISTVGQKCAICASMEDIERHHPDYNKPLEVVFLCPKHHPKRWNKE